MDGWYYDLEEIRNSPSFRDGIDGPTEAKYRKEGAKFIAEVANILKLRYVTAATGQVYYHRFYMLHSFKEFHRFIIGAACLFLAGKVEETPKKARDLFKAIQTCEALQQHNLNLQQLFGDDPKETLLTMERILLKTIKFDLQVEHPYKYMLRYAKTFKGDKAKKDNIAQTGWAFINDSLCTTLCLQWEPEIITIALIHLSCKLTKHEISDWVDKEPGYQGRWWDQFVENVSIDLLESICHQVLDFYANANEKMSKPPPGGDQRKRTSSEAGNVPPPPPNKQLRPGNPEESRTPSTLSAPPAQPYSQAVPGYGSNAPPTQGYSRPADQAQCAVSSQLPPTTAYPVAYTNAPPLMQSSAPVQQAYPPVSHAPQQYPQYSQQQQQQGMMPVQQQSAPPGYYAPPPQQTNVPPPGMTYPPQQQMGYPAGQQVVRQPPNRRSGGNPNIRVLTNN